MIDPKLSYPEVTNQVQCPQAQTVHLPNKQNATGVGYQSCNSLGKTSLFLI